MDSKSKPKPPKPRKGTESEPEIKTEKQSSLELRQIEERKKFLASHPSILQIASVNFKDTESDAIRESKPYIRCVHNIKTQDLVRHVISKKWNLRVPRIVLVIISNISPLTNNWKNVQQIRSFQKGLMKAAENTHMWLLVNGIDVGAGSIIGEAICNYGTEARHKALSDHEKNLSKFNFIGIADENMLKYGQKITSSEELRITVTDDGLTPADREGKHVLNPYFTHYVLVKDETINKNGVNSFLDNFIAFLTNNQKEGLKMESVLDRTKERLSDDMCSIETSEVPVVCIVIKGGFNSSRLVLDQIKNRLPVVALKGSGGLADLLAFVDIEIQERGYRDNWDPEFVETYLKPELTIRIVETYPSFRNNPLLCSTFRNRILESVRESRKDGQNYLTIINMLDTYSCNLENLTEYLLMALFKSQRTEQRSEPISSALNVDVQSARVKEALIKKDLDLCVDWNCPEVAKKEVLSKDPNFPLNNEKRLFEDSLIRTNRLEFVDLFLTQKFKLRSFISSKRLRRMFRRIHFRDFFSKICWESILGRSEDVKQSDKFLSRELNWLIEACTGFTTFINSDELDMFVTGLYPFSEKEAERKALEILVFWAVLDFRKDLVRVLWRHSDQPIHLAIIIAMSYERLSLYVSETNLTDELKEESKRFVDLSTKVLDYCYRDSVIRSEQVLNESNKDYEYKTPADLAAYGRLRQFFSHQMVQRWLTNKFYGNISVRDMRFTYFKVPNLVKLLLSAYLVFPMYIFIRLPYYIPKSQSEVDDDYEEDEDLTVGAKKPKESKVDEESDEASRLSAESTPGSSKKPKLKGLSSAAQHGQNQMDRIVPMRQQPPPWVLIYETWTAPVTKFWNFQLFYTLYLSIFSVAVLYPRCGHFFLDLVVSLWTLMILIEDIRQTYLIHVENRNASVTYRVVEICFVILFLFVYVSGRLLSSPSFTFIDPYDEKIILCIALLHAYYVLFTVFLPISATLGPLLYRLKIMILVDFLNFIRLSILVMISFGVIIQAILYPDADVEFELFRRTFHRAFFSLFLTPADELLVDSSCANKTRLMNGTDVINDVCSASIYTDKDCRVTGLWPYLFMSAYFVLLKLIMTTLLFAMFASSSQRLTADTDTIWKFQRYGLVMDFVLRSPLPPPLNAFYYIYRTVLWFKHKFNYFVIKDPNFVNNDLLQFNPEIRERSKPLADDDYAYLKLLASQAFESYEHQIRPDKLAVMQWERIQANSEELEHERRALRQLKGKMSEMERSIRQSLVFLETIKHLTTRKTGIDTISRKALHILSRYSPYPYTTVQRYPVPDKYVSWDVLWTDYDPIAYTKAKTEFTVSVQEFADEDILRLQELQLEKPKQNLPVYEWNRKSTNAAGITIDRQSWEMGDNENIIYKLDNGIPINPFGRTGLRGRGSLLRWGPNHYIMIIITRINENKLEVLVEKTNVMTNTISLIMRFIPGDTTYVGLEALFKPNDSNPIQNWTESEKMINYFKSFDETTVPTEPVQVAHEPHEAEPHTQTDTVRSDAVVESQPKLPNLKHELLVKAYFDDPLNTDQAWKELELWHFHYINQNKVLNENINDSIEWREVTESFFSVLTLSQSNVIQEIVNKLNISIR